MSLVIVGDSVAQVGIPRLRGADPSAHGHLPASPHNLPNCLGLEVSTAGGQE